ncbi:hypothetical protein KY285_031747 [Solanum tuberosum]|nr:hypothetical protein KY284_031529 [Solanum tuberosum]KAH0656865.1 hypothetical protein KY285_031747 [Solanum tuberosum]
MGGVKGKHWVAWGDMCLPKEEGGIEFRQIQDINKALFAKLWWNFRVSINSLWAEYMWNKYCKKMHPLIVNSSGASQVWKKMIKITEEVEHDIWWQIKSGNSSFWFDNWTRQGALYFTEGELTQDEELEVKDFIINDEWNEDKLRSVISEEMVQHITMNIRPILKEGSTDKAWWMHSTKGDFTVKSAYNNMRRKLSVNEWSNYMWVKGLPFKIGFFLWRVWRGRIATDDNLKRMRIQVVSKCYCCEEGQLETMSHLLLTAPIAQKLWKQFASCVGLSVTENLKQTIYRWWEHKMSHKLDQILKAVPAIIMWELWKRRNAIKHGKMITYNSMYYQCQLAIHQLIRIKFPWIKRMSHHWSEMVDILQRYQPNIHYLLVRWKMPREGWVTCNTDGASKGNPGLSAYGFCIRNRGGDLIYAEAQSIGEATNMEAEVRAVWEALKYCISQRMSNVHMDTDSLILKNMIVKNWKIPWEFAEKMEDIHEMVTQINVNVQHIFREANQLADFVANTAINREGK